MLKINKQMLNNVKIFFMILYVSVKLLGPVKYRK